jgi:hypothetical protein
MWVRALLVVVLVVLPQWVSAAVSISEVAWMGTAVSANHEWIELRNAGPAVDVTDWTLTDGMKLSVTLAGTIPANSYVVLERTSDDSAPGPAFLIYTGALVNTGTTLYLRRADGSLVDQVNGGENWENIGGDNATKETAQYTTGGWVTAVATPGRGITENEVAVAAAQATVAQTTTKTTKTTTVIKAKASEPVQLTLPGVTLQLAVRAQTLGYVHQPIKFVVNPTGIGDTLIASLQYEWNFGDGATTNTKEPTHVYRYPGTYVVTVYAGYMRQEQVARHEITILPVMLSLTTNQAGDVQVNNDSPYELDLSGYRLKGEREFQFPPRTVILPNQTITIPRSKLGATEERLVAVYDTEATMVAMTLPRISNSVATEFEILDHSPTQLISATYTENAPLITPTPDGDFGFSDTIQLAQVEVETPAEPGPAVLGVAIAEAATDGGAQLASVGATPLVPPERWPYIALALTLLVATLGLYVAPRRNQSD